MSYPRLYAANAAVDMNNFETLGIGTLSDAISCVVTEERNGEFELEMTYPIGGIHFSDITTDKLIMCKANESGTQQIFRIYKVEPDIVDGISTIYAEHISYLLSNIVVLPFDEVDGAPLAFSAIENNILWQSDNKNFKTFPFTFESQNPDAGKVLLETPSTVRSVLGGTDGSILDSIGGEYEFDNFKVTLWKERGSDNNVYLRYGKNITDLTNTVDISSAYTGIVPYWKGSLRRAVTNDDGNKTTESYDVIVYINDKALWSDNEDYAYPLASIVDMSQNIDSDVADVIETDSDGNEETTYYTTEDDIRKELQTLAESYLTTNKGWTPSDNLKVSFINLWDTPEYENFAALQRVNLCDTVHVIYQPLDIDVTMKVITTEYNVLMDRYDEIELGEPKSSFTTSVANSTSETESKINDATTEMKSEIQKAKDESTNIINGKINNLIGSNGKSYVILDTEADGSIKEILVMNEKDKNKATQVWRWNSNGLGYANSYNGTMSLALTMDGQIVADRITTGTLRANLIKAGILSDTKGKNYWNMETGEFSLQAVAGSTIGGKQIASTDDLTTTTLEYGISSAYTTEPTTWSEEISDAISTSYVWMREKVVDGNGRVTYGTPTCVSVPNSGRGEIYSTVQQYASSTSNTTAPTSGWSTTQPTYESGKYMWQRQMLSYRVYAEDGTYTTKYYYTGGVLTNWTNGISTTLATLNTQQGVFNKLTNNGQTQGIYLQNGKVYINAEYIQSGTLSARFIRGGAIENTDGTLQINLDDGNIWLANGHTFRIGGAIETYWGSNLIGCIRSTGVSNSSGGHDYIMHNGLYKDRTRYWAVSQFYDDGSFYRYAMLYDMSQSRFDLYGLHVYAESGGFFCGDYLYYTYSCTPRSDRRLKDDIADLDRDKAVEFIRSLKPSSFVFKAENGHVVHHGFIAQDLQESEYDEWQLVTETPGGDGYLGYKANEIIADMVATIQSQDKRITALEERISKLEEALNARD